MANVDDRLALDPLDAEEALVLADALLAEGDVRGELIVLQRALAQFERGELPGLDPVAASTRIDRLVRTCRRKILGEWATSRHLRLRFRIGNLERVRVARGGTEELAGLVVALDAPESGTLHTLEFSSSRVARQIVRLCRAEARCFPTITTLVIEPCETDGENVPTTKGYQNLTRVFPNLVELELPSEFANRVRVTRPLARLVISTHPKSVVRSYRTRASGVAWSFWLAQLGVGATIGLHDFAVSVATAVQRMSGDPGWSRVAALDLSRSSLDDTEARDLAEVLAFDGVARRVCVEGTAMTAEGQARLCAVPLVTVEGAPAPLVVRPIVRRSWKMRPDPSNP
ncbi:MAG: hypothetical protein NT062_29660 [Proteobacteria bacterium]|nr:hypothetical protein [Pseudomonadota bacterium]